MFIDNKYKRWYMAIVEKRRLDVPAEYCEEHHVIPTSLGGVDDRTNIVKLTGREHFICHKLLVKMTDGKEKRSMAFAMHKMAYGTNKEKYHISSRDYVILRRINADAVREMQLVRFSDPIERQKQAERAFIASMAAADKNRDNENFREACRQRNQKLVVNGTHNFLSGEIQRASWQDPSVREKHMKHMSDLVEQGEHVFQQVEFIEKNRAKIKEHWANMTPDKRQERCKKISDANKGKVPWNKGKKKVSAT